MAKNKKNKKTVPKRRNWTAVAAHFMTGAGKHPDKKKKKNKKACRGPVTW